MNWAAIELYRELSDLGFELEAHGESVRYRPKEAMTSDLAERVRACKPDLLELIRQPAVEKADRVSLAEPSRASRRAKVPPASCFCCGGTDWWRGFSSGRPLEWRCEACHQPQKGLAVERVSTGGRG